jgi:hypothetical protein
MTMYFRWANTNSRDTKLIYQIGLQCHSAPYSWKIAFECNSQLYEILLTAGTQTEERGWRRRLDRRSTNGNLFASDDVSFEFLDMEMRSLGTVFKNQGESLIRSAFTPLYTY